MGVQTFSFIYFFVFLLINYADLYPTFEISIANFRSPRSTNQPLILTEDQLKQQKVSSPQKVPKIETISRNAFPKNDQVDKQKKYTRLHKEDPILRPQIRNFPQLSSRATQFYDRYPQLSNEKKSIIFYPNYAFLGGTQDLFPYLSPRMDLLQTQSVQNPNLIKVDEKNYPKARLLSPPSQKQAKNSEDSVLDRILDEITKTEGSSSADEKPHITKRIQNQKSKIDNFNQNKKSKTVSNRFLDDEDAQKSIVSQIYEEITNVFSADEMSKNGEAQIKNRENFENTVLNKIFDTITQIFGLNPENKVVNNGSRINKNGPSTRPQHRILKKAQRSEGIQNDNLKVINRFLENVSQVPQGSEDQISVAKNFSEIPADEETPKMRISDEGEPNRNVKNFKVRAGFSDASDLWKNGQDAKVTLKNLEAENAINEDDLIVNKILNFISTVFKNIQTDADDLISTKALRNLDPQKSGRISKMEIVNRILEKETKSVTRRSDSNEAKNVEGNLEKIASDVDTDEIPEIIANRIKTNSLDKKITNPIGDTKGNQKRPLMVMERVLDSEKSSIDKRVVKKPDLPDSIVAKIINEILKNENNEESEMSSRILKKNRNGRKGSDARLQYLISEVLAEKSDKSADSSKSDYKINIEGL